MTESHPVEPSPANPLFTSGSKFGRLASTLGPLLPLVLVIVLFAAAESFTQGRSTFFSLASAWQISIQTAVVAIGALGMTVAIIAGGIDLSVGNALALSAAVLAWCLRAEVPVPLSISAGVFTGALAGCLNGVLISTLRIAPFIVTLGMMSVYLGLAKIVTDETTLRPTPGQVPDWFRALFSRGNDWLILAPGAWMALGLAILLAVVLRRTVFGRHVFALGSNESTARLCGINIPRLKIAVYTLSGLFIGLAAACQVARFPQVSPTSGIGYELRIIAAVVVGGASLNGGRG
ncbi:MAG TPA: ABC transporter permease, partial [Pirellulales bacterium]|nr:ABC transporter permease [Pirellulales bacterium]